MTTSIAASAAFARGKVTLMKAGFLPAVSLARGRAPRFSCIC